MSSESFVGSLTGGSAGSTSTVFLAKSIESATRKRIVSDAPILFAQPWAKWTSFRLLIGSVAHLNSSVPTAVDAKNGVKEKYEFGETIVTAMLGDIQRLVQQGLPSYSDLSALLLVSVTYKEVYRLTARR